MPRTLAIGDIHGCAAALEAILAAMKPAADDTLVTLGDYIDRGPESRRVIELLMEWSGKCKLITLLGNHEVMLLDARGDWRKREFWMECGGRQTLANYGDDFDSIPDAHWQFLENCLTYHETERHFFVHANYDPSRELAAQSEDFLYWMHLSFFTPWPHPNGKIAVVGHTPQADGNVLDHGHLICLDTCCFGGGFLSALDVDSGQLWQADKNGVPRT